jgi:hypothetical protein
MDGNLTLPRHEQGKLVSAYVPVVLGCSHACTYCIIPYKRGIERSRPAADILGEVRSLVAQGVREITLLGQIVDRYGKDLPDGPNLAQLLRQVHEVEGLERIRFLTSHPNWMTPALLDVVAELPKVMPHIEVPVQAGDDEVLARIDLPPAGDARTVYRKVRRRASFDFPEAPVAARLRIEGDRVAEASIVLGAVASAPIPPIGEVSNVAALGHLLYTRYVYFFQAAGLILLVAMIGAIVLTLRHKEGVKRQDISQQVARTREQSVEVRKVPSRKGI